MICKPISKTRPASNASGPRKPKNSWPPATAPSQGDPQQARRAFQAAYGLSTADAAFNEDARVQLHNIKLQQALVGLNVRQAAAAGDTAALGGKFRDLRGRKEVNYTQQDAKDIIDRNTADDNAAYMRLAERIIQQQDAAVSSPAAIRASIPEQGRVLTFKRAVVVDTWADLKFDRAHRRQSRLLGRARPHPRRQPADPGRLRLGRPLVPRRPVKPGPKLSHLIT